MSGTSGWFPKKAAVQNNIASKVHATTVFEAMGDRFKNVRHPPSAIDLTIDVDADGNVSEKPTGITLRAVFHYPCM